MVPSAQLARFSGLRLNEANEGQGETRSLGADGIWGLFGRPPERACEQCASPGHHVAVRVAAARVTVDSSLKKEFQSLKEASWDPAPK
jgi:hypothetical protein